MSTPTKRSNSKSDWHRQDVLAAIRKKGISLAELARRNGYGSPKTIYNVFNVSYPKAEKIIADFLEIPASDIWPSRYESRAA